MILGCPLSHARLKDKNTGKYISGIGSVRLDVRSQVIHPTRTGPKIEIKGRDLELQ